MTRVGYVRVSTQDLDSQIARLKMADCKIVRSETGPDALRIGRGMMLAVVAGSFLLLSTGSHGQTADAAGSELGSGGLALCQIGIGLTRSYALEYGASTASLNCPGGTLDASFALDNAGVSKATAHVTVSGDGFSQIVDVAQAMRAADATQAVNGAQLQVVDQAVNIVEQGAGEERGPQADDGAETKIAPDDTVAQSGGPLTTGSGGSGVDALLWDSGAPADNAAQQSPNTITDVAPDAAASSSSSSSSSSSTEAIGDLQPDAAKIGNAQPDDTDRLDDPAAAPGEAARTEDSLDGAGGLVPPSAEAGVSNLEAVNISQIRGATDVIGSGIGIETDGSIIVPTYIKTKPKTVVHKIGDALDQIDDGVMSLVDNLPAVNDTPMSTGHVPVTAAPKEPRHNNARGGSLVKENGKKLKENGKGLKENGKGLKENGKLRKPPNAVLRAPAKPVPAAPHIVPRRGAGDSKYWVDGN